jgi:tRNA 2-thiouridine synthesizing protein A
MAEADLAAAEVGLNRADAHVDAIGLRCPLPALKIKRALARLEAGQCLEALADDPLAAIDIPHLVSSGGDEMIATQTRDGVMRFLIRKQGERR